VADPEQTSDSVRTPTRRVKGKQRGAAGVGGGGEGGAGVVSPALGSQQLRGDGLDLLHNDTMARRNIHVNPFTRQNRTGRVYG
jgi:hypothetical protein